MNEKQKIISLLMGFWVLGLIYQSVAPGLPDPGFTLDFIFSPFLSLIGYLFLGFGIVAFLVAGIILGISEKLLKKYPSRALTVILYSFVIPGSFWFVIMKFMIGLAEKYPNGI
ncbi:MAG: hypothetical protein V4697_02590 [Patescibacteria group bacterium]